MIVEEVKGEEDNASDNYVDPVTGYFTAEEEVSGQDNNTADNYVDQVTGFFTAEEI